jgi:DNA recombination protein RmuC
MGRSLERAVEAYNSGIGSLESRVMVSARRFADLKTAPLGVEIPVLEPVDKAAIKVEISEPRPSGSGTVRVISE